MLIAVIAVSGSKAGVVAFTLFILLVWWVGLGIFAAHPVGGEFRVERRLAKSFIESQGSNGAKLAARVAFFVLYWPIFISKDFYFWSILFVAGLYYALKHFNGK